MLSHSQFVSKLSSRLGFRRNWRTEVIFPAGRCFSLSREEFEEEHHLARGLSKIQVSSSQIETWKREVGRIKPWKAGPLELYPSPQYEFNALKLIHKRSYDCNVLIEIRDVRLPASSHHPSFSRLARHRLHLICYTHADLIDDKTRDKVEEWSRNSWPDSRSIFVDSREHRKDVQFGLMYDSLMKHLDSRGGMNVALTVGVANTGKSSVLLSLLRYARQHELIPKKLQSTSNYASHVNKKKKRKLFKQGPPGVQDQPGKTRELTEYLIRENPKAFFLDVPGLTPPKFFFEERPESWFGMAAANLLPLSSDIQQDVEAQVMICKYALHALHRDGNYCYVKRLNMDGPSTDIYQILSQVGGSRIQNEEKRLLKQCSTFLKLLNTGNFGPVILDDIGEKYREFQFKDHHFDNERDRDDNSDY